MLNLYELCGIQIGVALANEGLSLGLVGSPAVDRKPKIAVSSDPASPRKRNAEEIAANRAKALAKVSQLKLYSYRNLN